MRVTGGEFCGRTLRVPDSEAIRPTQDRVREALFSILAPELREAKFLDLFAGSGSVGIEALSRGASSVVFVENMRRHVAVLEANLKTLSLTPPRASVVVSQVESWVSSYSGPGFSIAFADPPYVLWREGGLAEFLKLLAQRSVVSIEGLFIAETDMAMDAQEVEGWQLLRDRLYGKTRIAIWRRKK
ncbi:MAG: 16S rRNA (guanine(966)-N(2))-methyltransferase RsmD [Kiritimatiellae bacterium]|nr:16S rRNA (guanine(966)-N(2))-methyltransferase RsmD [Kiritimatiellia bacterium]